MIEFKPVRLEDKQTIERYTMPSGIYNCDLAFANMYCWQALWYIACQQYMLANARSQL